MAYTIDEEKELIIRAGKELLESGLIARTWGNISARISRTQFLITPSGRAYDSLRPEDIVLVDIADGKVPEAKEKKGRRKADAAADGESTVKRIKPSSEKGVHAAVYRQRPEVNFVIHTHQDFATSLSTLGRQFKFKKIDPAVRRVLGPYVPTARYALSSTRALEKHVESAVAKYPQAKSVLMRNHGTVCMGTDYENAFDIARTLESVCEMKYRQLVGGELPEVAKESASAETAEQEDVVLHREIHEEYDQHYLVFENKQIGCLIETAEPFVLKAASFGEDMKVYVDDLAQMAGTTIKCLPGDASEKEIAKALSPGASGAVLLQGKGAVCAGGTADDAEALKIVLGKGCQAALLARVVREKLEKAGKATRANRAKSVPKAGGKLEHVIYTKKYSKLKDAGEESC